MWVPLGVPYAPRPPGVYRRWRYGTRYVLPYRLSPNAHAFQPGMTALSVSLLVMLPLAFAFWFVIIWANRPLHTTLAAGAGLVVFGAGQFVPFSRVTRALALDRARHQLTFVLLLPATRDCLLLRRLAPTSAPMFAALSLIMAHTAAMHLIIARDGGRQLLLLYVLLIVEAAQLQALSIALGVWEGGRGFRALRHVLPPLLLGGLLLIRAVGGWFIASELIARDGYQRAGIVVGPLLATGWRSVPAVLSGLLYLAGLELLVRAVFRTAIRTIGDE